MIFKRERSLNEKKFLTRTSFKEYGGGITQEEEIELFKNLGAPTIDMGGEHSGYFDLVDGVVTLIEEPAGDPEELAEIKILLNKNSVKVDENFSMEFLADAKKEDPVGVLAKAAQVAEAKCILFEHCLDEVLEEAITNLVNKKTDFEDEYPVDLIIPPVAEN